MPHPNFGQLVKIWNSAHRRPHTAWPTISAIEVGQTCASAWRRAGSMLADSPRASSAQEARGGCSGWRLRRRARKGQSKNMFDLCKALVYTSFQSLKTLSSFNGRQFTFKLKQKDQK